MWAFFDNYSSDDRTLDRLRAGRGFCAEHAERLRRLEVEGLHSNLGISNVYLDMFKGLEETLDVLELDEDLGERGPCPACAYRDEEVENNARFLLLRDEPPEQAYEVPHYARVATNQRKGS